MKLGEIYVSLKQGKTSPESFRLLAALEHLARLEQVAPYALDYAGSSFSQAYPALTPPPGWTTGATTYSAWRTAILNQMMQSAPCDTDGDPWTSLKRAARQENMPLIANRLRQLATQLPPNTRPSQVTSDLLRGIHLSFSEPESSWFRSGISAFRRLFDLPLAVATGLLPLSIPDMPPAPRDHRGHVGMSPDLLHLRKQMEAGRGYECALDYVNRLGVQAGLLDGKTDTIHHLLDVLPWLPAPETVDVPIVGMTALRSYIYHVRAAARRKPWDFAWLDLMNAAGAADRPLNMIHHISRPARAHGVGPQKLTAQQAQRFVDLAGRERSYVRRGCEQLDALIGHVSAEHLPPAPLGIRRLPKPIPVTPAHISIDLIALRWKELDVKLKAHASEVNYPRRPDISYLRAHAVKARISPEDLTQGWIDKLSKNANQSGLDRLRRAIRDLHRFDRQGIEIPVLQEPEDRRFTAGIASAALISDLKELWDEMGASSSTRRSQRVAVVALDEVCGGGNSLSGLLNTDPDQVDWGRHAGQGRVYARTLQSLRRWNELPWTPAWRKLQRGISASGIPLSATPVPYLLYHAVNKGMEPWDLNLAWAQNVDRAFRSTIEHPPHGRADIALKFARHMAALDMLRETPEVVAAGLPPSKIGPLR